MERVTTCCIYTKKRGILDREFKIFRNEQKELVLEHWGRRLWECNLFIFIILLLFATMTSSHSDLIINLCFWGLFVGFNLWWYNSYAKIHVILNFDNHTIRRVQFFPGIQTPRIKTYDFKAINFLITEIPLSQNEDTHESSYSVNLNYAYKHNLTICRWVLQEDARKITDMLNNVVRAEMKLHTMKPEP